MICNKIPINDLVHDVAQLKHVSIQSSRLDCSKTFVDTIAIHKFKITSKLEEAQYRAYPNFTSINTKGHRTEISACAHALRDATWPGQASWEKKLDRPTRVTLSCQPSDPTRARFAVSHVNGRRWFISNCRKTWLAPVDSGVGVPWVPGPYKRTLYGLVTYGRKACALYDVLLYCQWVQKRPCGAYKSHNYTAKRKLKCFKWLWFMHDFRRSTLTDCCFILVQVLKWARLANWPSPHALYNHASWKEALRRLLKLPLLQVCLYYVIYLKFYNIIITQCLNAFFSKCQFWKLRTVVTLQRNYQFEWNF